MVRLVHAVDFSFRDRACHDLHLAILYADLPATRHRALRDRGRASCADSRERGHSHVGLTSGRDRLGNDAARRRLAYRRLTASLEAAARPCAERFRGTWARSNPRRALR